MAEKLFRCTIQIINKGGLKTTGFIDEERDTQTFMFKMPWEPVDANDKGNHLLDRAWVYLQSVGYFGDSFLKDAINNGNIRTGSYYIVSLFAVDDSNLSLKLSQNPLYQGEYDVELQIRQYNENGSIKRNVKEVFYQCANAQTMIDFYLNTIANASDEIIGVTQRPTQVIELTA